jgi:N-acetylglucosaminyldiphosphoundecaprenol N-acetyl-beta-D-mannosaminyltransferase
LETAAFVFPDGPPHTLATRFFRKNKQVRISGYDIIPGLVELLQECTEGGRITFYGGSESVLNAIDLKLSKEYPRVTGQFISPPFRALTEEENSKYRQDIQGFKPDVILVSLGCPKQEKWMFENAKNFNACSLGVGYAFYTFSGMAKRVPDLIQSLGLEWAYRLFQDPKRLFKRYAITNTHFIWLFLKQLVTGKGA